MMDEAPEPDVAMLRRHDVVAMLTEGLSEAFAVSHYGWFDDTVAINSDWGFSLEAVQVPVLVVHGGLDRNAPVSQVEALVEDLPRAAALRVAGSAPRDELKWSRTDRYRLAHVSRRGEEPSEPRGCRFL